MSTQNFSDRLYEFKGRIVKIFLTNGQNAEGTLLDITDLHVAIVVDPQVVYYARGSVQGFSISTKIPKSTSANALTLGMFQQLYDELSQIKYEWLTITSGDGQTYSGFLSRVYEDHVVLINQENQLVVPFVTISQYQLGEIKEEKSEEASNEAEENKSDASAESGGKKTKDSDGKQEKKTKDSYVTQDNTNKETKQAEKKNEIENTNRKSESNSKSSSKSRSKSSSKSHSKSRKEKWYESSCGCRNYTEPYFPYTSGNGFQRKEQKNEQRKRESSTDGGSSRGTSREMLEAQFSSLEKQAKRNMNYLSGNQKLSYEDRSAFENQYTSLMKHARKQRKQSKSS